jgi:hypothetical protein
MWRNKRGSSSSYDMTNLVKVTSESKSKKHGPITGSDKNRSEPVRGCDWSMLSAFAFARYTLTHFVISRDSSDKGPKRHRMPCN